MSDLAKNKAQPNDVQMKLINWQRTLEGFRSRKDTIIEMQEDYHGFSPGVREVLKAQNRNVLPGIHGVVASLLHVPEVYEASIEAILGDAVQYVVVQTDDSAKKAIQYLLERKSGRAAFLSMDRIREVIPPEKDLSSVSQMRGYLGRAIDLVSFDNEHLKVFSYLLGDVIVVETLEVADRIAKKLRQHYRLVTLQGDIITVEGLMVAGSVPIKSSSLLGRKHLISELNEMILNAEYEIAVLKAQIE